MRNRVSAVLILILVLWLNGTEKMNMKNYVNDGFSWVVDKTLSGMPFPGVFEPVEKDIGFLREKGITLLVSLTMKTPDQQLLKKAGIRSVHFPVEDFHAPSGKQLKDFCLLAEEEIGQKGRVAVHCYAGKGRTGTFLAAYFVWKGADPEGAIDLIRELRPGSIETEEQEEAVKEFSRHP